MIKKISAAPITQAQSHILDNQVMIKALNRNWNLLMIELVIQMDTPRTEEHLENAVKKNLKLKGNRKNLNQDLILEIINSLEVIGDRTAK